MSDLAIEFIGENGVKRENTRVIGGNRVIYTDIGSESEALAAGKKIGEYYSVLKSNAWVSDAIADCVNRLVKKIGGKDGKLMLIGLGNPFYAADALGDAVLDRIEPNSGLVKVYPSVSAVTGIESTAIIKAMAELIRPRLIVVIDTLCTDSAERLNAVYQLTTAGISPGGGIGGRCESLTADSLGAPVIAVGVPLAVRIRTGGRPGAYTPVEINDMVLESADIISSALRKAFKAHA